MSWLRWLAVILSALAAYILTAIAGMLSLQIAEQFCPPDLMVSGQCTAAYMYTFQTAAFLVFPSIASMLVVWFPYLVAPKNKGAVAMTSFLLGSAYAVYAAYSTGLWVVLGFVLFFGFLMTWFLVRRDRKRVSDLRG